MGTVIAFIIIGISIGLLIFVFLYISILYKYFGESENYKKSQTNEYKNQKKKKG